MSLLKRDDKDSKNNGYFRHIQDFLNNKTNLFYVLSISFTSIIVYPVLVPHLFHPGMIYHIAIHIISFDMALFLTVISILSFKKTKSKRVLLTSFNFSILLIVNFYICYKQAILLEIIIYLILKSNYHIYCCSLWFLCLLLE